MQNKKPLIFLLTIVSGLSSCSLLMPRVGNSDEDERDSSQRFDSNTQSEKIEYISFVGGDESFYVSKFPYTYYIYLYTEEGDRVSHEDDLYLAIDLSEESQYVDCEVGIDDFDYSLGAYLIGFTIYNDGFVYNHYYNINIEAKYYFNRTIKKLVFNRDA
jgi:hypothetical protein